MTLAHWIEYPSEPKELLLVWQAPLAVPDRLRWAVGRLTKVGDEAVFDYLRGEEFAALNLGRSDEALRAAGYSGYPAFDTRKRREGDFRDRVLEAFLRRVPSATRSDFPGYLAHHLIKPSTPLSPFALLGVTEARLPSDGFSLVDPLDVSADCVDLVFEIAGFRYHGHGGVSVGTGDALELELDPSNQNDPNAVQVKAGGQVIGYVNRLQALTIRTWVQHRSVACRIARIIGPPESQWAYAFLQVRPAQKSIAA